MNLLAPVLALTLAACGSASSVLPASSALSVVENVTDGDTITAGGTKIRIRGLDTPETKKPGVPVQCGGPEATEYARAHLLGRQVRLVVDPDDAVDRYGRAVAEVWIGEHSYARDAVRAGMGRAHLFDRRHPASNWPDIQRAEQQARAERIGMWRCPG